MSLRPIARTLIAVASAGWMSLAPTQAADMSVTANGRILVITGDILEWDHCVAARLLAAHTSIRQVRINSRGGYAWAGAYLGRLFGWAGLEAVVPKGAVAESAAGVAVIGAPRRMIAGQVGLHGPWLAHPGQSLMSRIILAETSAEMSSVLELGGMPPERIRRAMEYSQDRLYRIDGIEISSFHHHGRPDPAMVQRAAISCGAHP